MENNAEEDEENLEELDGEIQDAVHIESSRSDPNEEKINASSSSNRKRRRNTETSKSEKSNKATSDSWEDI